MSCSDTKIPDEAPVLTIRHAVAGDYEVVVRIDAETSGFEKPDYWSDIFSQYVTEEDTRRYLVVADLAGTTVGFALGEVRAWEFGSPPCGWVFGLGVTADVREHRVGSALVEDMFERFRLDGVSNVRTNVSRRDTLNLSFFRSLGMTAGPYVQLEYNLDEQD